MRGRIVLFGVLPTGEDIQALKTLIAEKESTETRWLLGILATAAITIAVAMFKVFAE